MPYNPGIQLPTSVSGTGRFIDLADVSPIFPTDKEIGATGHWLFGSDYPDYRDLISDQVMAVSGSAPTLNDNRATFAAGNNKLQTPFNDVATETVCIVYKNKANADYRAPVGLWQDSANLVFIHWQQTTAGAGNYLQVAADSRIDGDYVGLLLSPLPTGLDADEYTFIAYAFGADGSHVYWGDKTYYTAEVKGSRALPIGVGSIHTSGLGTDIAELIVFSGTKLTSQQVAGVRGRSIARMAARPTPITIGG